MFKKGNRMYSVSTWMTLVIAIMHTMGVFQKPSAAEGLSVFDAMKGQRFQAMGMDWSMYDVSVSIALTMTVQLVFVVVANFVVLYSSPSAVFRRKWVLLNVVLMWCLAGLYTYFQIPPPFLSFVLLGILFTVTYFRSGLGEVSG